MIFSKNYTSVLCSTVVNKCYYINKMYCCSDIWLNCDSSVNEDMWKMQCVVAGAFYYVIFIVIGSQPIQSLQFEDMLFLLKMLNCL